MGSALTPSIRQPRELPCQPHRCIRGGRSRSWWRGSSRARTRPPQADTLARHRARFPSIEELHRCRRAGPDGAAGLPLRRPVRRRRLPRSAGERPVRRLSTASPGATTRTSTSISTTSGGRLASSAVLPVFDKKRVFAVQGASCRRPRTTARQVPVLLSADRRRQHDVCAATTISVSATTTAVYFNPSTAGRHSPASTWRSSPTGARSRPTRATSISRLKHGLRHRFPLQHVQERLLPNRHRLRAPAKASATSSSSAGPSDMRTPLPASRSAPSGSRSRLRRRVDGGRATRAEVLSRRSDSARPRNAGRIPACGRSTSASSTISSRTRFSARATQTDTRAVNVNTIDEVPDRAGSPTASARRRVADGPSSSTGPTP